MPLVADFAGPQGFFEGLDQVNVKIPRTLRGAGELDVIIVHAGKRSNSLTVRF